MTTRAEIEAWLREQLIDDHQVKPGDVRPEARMREDLAMDSLDMLELSLTASEHFGIELRDSDVDRMQTFGAVVDVVERYVRAP